MSNREKIAAANWKMNLLPAQGLELVQQLAVAERPEDVQVIIAAPYVHLPLLSARYQASDIAIAAQNMHQSENGAYTGEISAAMLVDLDVDAVILGHSERRHYFGETDESIAEKLSQALRNELRPIYCCGETLQVRQSNKQEEWVGHQVRSALSHLSTEDAAYLIVAYEPVWAIGTGETATPQQAQAMHVHIRGVLSDLFSQEVANEIPILYGGSVKPNNASELFAQPDVDGGLVGGASLKFASFLEIIQAF